MTKLRITVDGPGKAIIMQNLKKKNPKEPDFKGIITDDLGDEYYISLWKQKGENVVFLKGNVTRKTDVRKQYSNNQKSNNNE